MTNDFNMHQFARDVAAHLPGWAVEADEMDRNHAYLTLHKMRLSLTHEWRRDGKHRVNVRTWGWPKYQRLVAGTPREERLSPSELREPRESSPDISCAIGRGAEAVARDIARRVIPHYERIWNRLAGIAGMREHAERAAFDGWREICAAINADSRHGRHYVDGPNGHVVIENRDGRAYVSLTLDAAQLTAILEALKPSA